MKIDSQQVAKVLHRYWYWFDSDEVFFGTDYSQKPGRIAMTDGIFETFPNMEALSNAVRNTDVSKMHYKANIWDCENFSMSSFSEIRQQWKGSASPAHFIGLGKINGRYHSINLAIVGTEWDSLQVKLIEPQLRHEIWDPYVPPFQLQDDFYTYLNQMVQGQTTFYDDPAITFVGTEKGGLAAKLYSAHKMWARQEYEQGYAAIMAVLAEAGLTHFSELAGYFNGDWSVDGLKKNFTTAPPDTHYQLFPKGSIVERKQKWIEVRHPDLGKAWHGLADYTQLLPDMLDSRVKAISEHWFNTYGAVAEKHRKEDRIFLVIA